MRTDPIQALRTHLAVTGGLRAEVERLRALLDAKAQECCTADCCTEREMAQAYSRELAAEVERLRALVQALEEENAREEDGRRGVPCPACGHGSPTVKRGVITRYELERDLARILDEERVTHAEFIRLGRAGSQENQRLREVWLLCGEVLYGDTAEGMSGTVGL